MMREKGLGKQVLFSKGAVGEHVCWGLSGVWGGRRQGARGGVGSGCGPRPPR